uniref:Lipoprotein n=1 Tax=Panagrellus redivivus TaxID=6233 RepID=A0A7E4UNN6_PANRE
MWAAAFGDDAKIPAKEYVFAEKAPEVNAIEFATPCDDPMSMTLKQLNRDRLTARYPARVPVDGSFEFGCGPRSVLNLAETDKENAFVKASLATVSVQPSLVNTVKAPEVKAIEFATPCDDPMSMTLKQSTVCPEPSRNRRRKWIRKGFIGNGLCSTVFGQYCSNAFRISDADTMP